MKKKQFEINYNKKFNGIEVKFAERPITEMLNILKSYHFHWHREKKLWYAKVTPEKEKLVKELQTMTNEEIIYKMQLLKKADVKSKKTKAKTKTEPKNIFGVQIGDVFYDSWGYDQTNIDFYQVVGLKGKTTVELKPVKKKRKSIGYCSDLVTPIKDEFLEGNYKTRLVDGETETITRRCNGGRYGLYVGAECLHPTSWNCELNETRYA